MRRRPRALVTVAGLLLLALVPPAAAALAQPFYVDLFRRMMIFALAALSLDLILGYGGMVSFGHAAYLGIGAYAVGILGVYGIESGLIQWPVAILIVFLALGSRLVASRFGMVVRAAKSNEPRARAIGFSLFRYKLTAFVIAGGAGGLAGALLANQTEYLTPDFMHWTRSGEIMFMVILGGVGTLFGPVVGAVVLLLLEDVLSALTAHWQIILGPFLVLVVLFAKRGLFGLVPEAGERRG